MKKVLFPILCVLLTLSFCACGLVSSIGGGGVSKPATSTPASPSAGSPSATPTPAPTSGTPETTVPETGNVVGVKSDKYAPNVGSEAERYWQVKDIEMVYAFDASGKCTVRDTVYYLKDNADLEEVTRQIAGWSAVWNDDKKSFRIDRGFKDYTTVDDAIDEIAKAYHGYTITYAGGATKHIDEPTEERKVELMREVFGFTFDDVQTTYGAYTYSYTRQRDKVLVTYINNATVDDINALGQAAFEVCKTLGDDGKMYSYLGKYGGEITEAPISDSIFFSCKFNYFKNGKEIAVEAEILNSEGYENTLALFVAVVS